jgi:FkbM family methyltransferase
MQTISYAQNNEDIILWRALKSIKNGFYIDVGANHPINDSITKLFYENGWRGINIEPVKDMFEKLKDDRPEDINLDCLIGSENKTINFYEIKEDSRLSTTDKHLAEKYALENNFTVSESKIEMLSLNKIYSIYKIQEIHFLKIDVEGGEGEVLKGFPFDFIKPWIIVVESTLPCSNKSADTSWEPILLNNNYDYVFFDGLSRYYLNKKFSNLKAFFLYPAGIHDSFITYKQFIIEKELRELNAEYLSTKKTLNNKIIDMQNSLSWRLTLPIRLLDRFFKKIFNNV